MLKVFSLFVLVSRLVGGGLWAVVRRGCLVMTYIHDLTIEPMPSLNLLLANKVSFHGELSRDLPAVDDGWLMGAMEGVQISGSDVTVSRA